MLDVTVAHGQRIIEELRRGTPLSERQLPARTGITAGYVHLACSELRRAGAIALDEAASTVRAPRYRAADGQWPPAPPVPPVIPPNRRKRAA